MIIISNVNLGTGGKPITTTSQAGDGAQFVDIKLQRKNMPHGGQAREGKNCVNAFFKKGNGT
jgi:hypothetical protein